ncbi:MAG: hypothetical protein CMB70_05595 [Euryarchaeota archaeon]|nr:hypothetical protein [Euryarchaeota archaeon]|tara:strand:+ start:4378 stop:5376 length:999 start_codon:yes stop_codon:yes gene_type:complete
MEVWLESAETVSLEGIDALYVHDGQTGISSKDGILYRDNVPIGGHIHIDSEEAQSKARSLAGTVEWILLTFEDWSMIPIENILAATDATPTKVAAQIRQPIQAQGAAFALDIGVDALLCDETCLEAALVVKSMRLEQMSEMQSTPTETAEQIKLETMIITEVQEGHSGDRVCIDLLSMLEEGEGLLIGSTARAFILIHGETVPSKYVPTRPFRVNSGSVDAYTYLADGSTKYLCELTSGDSILVVSTNGHTRAATVGRMKIETRPFILLRFKDENANEGHAFIQQAETVRLVLENGNVCSVTNLEIGMRILGCTLSSTRHVGQGISAPSEER